ncbi:MAG: GNAT family N-acetyltransferase [Pseudomonadota bacterium]
MSDDVVMRRARAEDVGAIVDMLADDRLGRLREDPSSAGRDRYLDAFAAVDRQDSLLLAVAVDDDRIVGCLQLAFLPGLSHQGLVRGQIESVRIAAGHRGRRLGETMIEWAIEQCRERGCGLVQLTSDTSRTDAARFYERLGFRPTHVGFKLSLRP